MVLQRAVKERVEYVHVHLTPGRGTLAPQFEWERSPTASSLVAPSSATSNLSSGGADLALTLTLSCKMKRGPLRFASG